MCGNDEDLSAYLQSFGFSEDELNCVMDELNSFRSIPGTTIERYMNRVINTIEGADRHTFLKGILVGIVIRKTEDDLEQPPLTEEEMRINHEIEKLGLSG